MWSILYCLKKDAPTSKDWPPIFKRSEMIKHHSGWKTEAWVYLSVSPTLRRHQMGLFTKEEVLLPGLDYFNYSYLWRALFSSLRMASQNNQIQTQGN